VAGQRQPDEHGHRQQHQRILEQQPGDDRDGERLLDPPNVEIAKGLQIGGTAIYTDRQFGGYSDNRAATQTAAGVVTIVPATKTLYRTIDDYWRFDLRASYEVARFLQLSVNAQNITDKTYFSQAYSAHYASIAPGRTVLGTVTLRY
jgi:catecholate siderophore receptor